VTCSWRPPSERCRVASLHTIRERLRLSLWFFPALLAAFGALLALVMVAIDRELDLDGEAPFFVFAGSPEGARSVLSTIAQSMLTFTGLVFTITMLVLQLASNQLSPRVMRTFLRDRGNQLVLGLFVATFVFTLLVLREVRTPIDGGDAFVPAISVWVAFALLLSSVGAFIWYIDHMAHSIRASTVIENIWHEAVGAIDRRYPDPFDAAPEPEAPAARPEQRPDAVLKSPKAGIVTSIDEDRLLAATAQGGRVVEIVPMIGEFVPAGAPLAQVWGTWDQSAADEVRGAVVVGGERTLDQDPAFGFRQLVDVAVRALSPGTNDPTTAVGALDRIHDLLRRLALRRFPSPVRVADGRVRLLVPRVAWDAYVRLALDEIRLSGQSQLQVMRRLRGLLKDLAAIVPADRLPPVREQLGAVDAGIERGFAGQKDRDAARASGGIGRADSEAPIGLSRPRASRAD
jgi:uncharacterized membrane protein